MSSSVSSDYIIEENTARFDEMEMTNHSAFHNYSAYEFANHTQSRKRFPTRFYRPSEFEITLQNVNYYSYPAIIVLGSIGNILAYLVFTNTRLKKVSSLRYLAAIAITDTGYLWTVFLSSLQYYYKQPLLTYVGVCQLVNFMNCAFTFLSIWYMVALVVDQFIAFYMPLSKSDMCTVFRAKLVIVGIGALSVVCYSYITYFYGVNKRFNHIYCAPFSEFEIHYMNLDKIDIIFVAVIPYIVIFILVVMILMRGREYYKMSTDVSPIVVNRRRIPEAQQHSKSSSTKIARILCPVIALTLIFSPPQNIMRTIMRFSDSPRPELNQWLDLCRVFYLLNIALKGYLYIMFSGGYRRRLRAFITESRLKIRHACTKGQPRENDPQIIRMEDSKSGLPQTAI